MALETILLGTKTLTTDVSAFTADTTSFPVRRHQLLPPYVLGVTTANAGATAPSGTINIRARIDHCPTSSGEFFAGVASSTAIAAAGTKTDATSTLATQLLPYIKVLLAAAAGTWASGTTMKVYLTGRNDKP